MGGQDASIVPGPSKRNEAGTTGRCGSSRARRPIPGYQPAKRSQKDTDARWTKKHGKSRGYGYEEPPSNVDRIWHKLVARPLQVTDAAEARQPGCG